MHGFAKPVRNSTQPPGCPYQHKGRNGRKVSLHDGKSKDHRNQGCHNDEQKDFPAEPYPIPGHVSPSYGDEGKNQGREDNEHRLLDHRLYVELWLRGLYEIAYPPKNTN